MKVLLIIFFLWTDQYILFDKKSNKVGSMAVHGDTLWLKINGYKADTFVVEFTERIVEGKHYAVKNDYSFGIITVRYDIVHVDLIISGNQHLYRRYYLKRKTN